MQIEPFGVVLVVCVVAFGLAERRTRRRAEARGEKRKPDDGFAGTADGSGSSTGDGSLQKFLFGDSNGADGDSGGGDGGGD